MATIFNEDFREFINALNIHQVKYLLVGGYAVILNGYRRTSFPATFSLPSKVSCRASALARDLAYCGAIISFKKAITIGQIGFI